jgi:hypothetical protein
MVDCRSETPLAPGQQEVDRRNARMLNIKPLAPRLSAQALTKGIDDDKRSAASGQSDKVLSPSLFFDSATAKSADEIGEKQRELGTIQSSTKAGTTVSQPRTPARLNFRITMFPSYIPKTYSMITDRSGSTRSSILRPIVSLLTTATRSLNPSLQDQAFSTPSSVRSMPTVSLPRTKALAASSSPRPSPSPKQTGDQVA